ncbi:FAD-dependent oxidoreductase [Paenibacillus sp. P25]|nr:FAD-dependent oxidoreductase [Paenibacillus sp. P25]
MTQAFDVIVLGGGIGGYTAAIRAAQLGKTVAIVERDKLGGTCLHRGCIPSKALLRSAELYATMKESGKFGIQAESVRLDFGQVHARKAAIVEQLHTGVQYLMKKIKLRCSKAGVAARPFDLLSAQRDGLGGAGGRRISLARAEYANHRHGLAAPHACRDWKPTARRS